METKFYIEKWNEINHKDSFDRSSWSEMKLLRRHLQNLYKREKYKGTNAT